MLNCIGFHVFGMFGVSWGVCILSSTSCICVFKKIEAHLQLHCRPRSCFPNAFPDEKKLQCSFLWGVRRWAWLNKHELWPTRSRTSNPFETSESTASCSPYTASQKKLCPKDLPLILQMCDSVWPNLCEYHRIPFLKEDLTDLVKDLPRANMGKRKSLFIYYTSFISLWHLPSWSPTMWQHLTHVLCHLQQLQSWSPKTSFLCACDARAFAVFQENIMGKWELKSQLRSN